MSECKSYWVYPLKSAVDSEPGDIHVVLYSDYQKIQAEVERLDELAGALRTAVEQSHMKISAMIEEALKK